MQTDKSGNTSGHRRSKKRIIDGLLPLDKPVGLTSNGALQRVKHIYCARKAGHTGSLDPLASGMLPICFGQATKLSGYLLGADKTYIATARFGAKTDTADADGRIIAESACKEVSSGQLDEALLAWRGEIQQVPPMYSALKKDGKRLYELAREGKSVPREPRTVRIEALTVEHFDPREPVLRVRCSKGTYIRTLVEDIAETIGTLGHVIALRRLSVYPFDAGDLVSMEELQAASEDGPEALDRFLLPLDQAIADWPAVYLNKEESYYLRQGHTVNAGPDKAAPGPESSLVRLYDGQRLFLGIGEVKLDGRIAPKRLFPALGAGPG
jgi:tRNA pseudouridine55 synthase